MSYGCRCNNICCFSKGSENWSLILSQIFREAAGSDVISTYTQYTIPNDTFVTKALISGPTGPGKNSEFYDLPISAPTGPGKTCEFFVLPISGPTGPGKNHEFYDVPIENNISINKNRYNFEMYNKILKTIEESQNNFLIS